MKKLKISPDLSLPIDFVTSTQAILAKKGRGKSYTASVQAEELLELGQQIVVVDPTGAWHGLRSSADGKHAGYPIAVLGGEHGDVPLETTAGEVIGDAIASERFSAILDLSLFRKGEANRFMGVLLETLYRKNRDALHLFIDEADTVAPQKPFGDEARTLGACEDIVRRGRIRGIGATLITQRPQVLNKNVLSQVDMLTTLGMNHPKDIAAIKEWVAVHGDEDQAKLMISELPSLPIGQAWIWAPTADIFKRVTIRRRRTFDSGKTPKAGERALAPKVLAPVDIERLGQTIAATVEKAKANDPKALRARVVELEKLLAAKAPTARVETKVVERSVFKPAEVKRVEALASKFDAIAVKLHSFSDELETRAGTLERLLQAAQPKPGAPSRGPHDLEVGPAMRAAGIGARAPTPRKVAGGSDNASLPVGEAATLRALIMYPGGLRREQLAVLTGYKRSTRDAYIARLREKGLVDANLAMVFATDAGRAAMPDAEPLPTGAALRDWWLSRLPTGEGTILSHLIEAYPARVMRSALDEMTGFKRSTRDAYLSRLAARQLVEDVGRGEVVANNALFEGST